VSESEEKFLPAHAAANVATSAARFQNFGELPEDHISSCVSPGIIHTLKVVQVSHNDVKGKSVPDCSA
jgi:hypothetical protein